MADEQGTREISSIHQLIDATGANARLWGSPTRRIAAPVFAVSITYIPAPSALALASASILFRRRRASLHPLYSFAYHSHETRERLGS